MVVPWDDLIKYKLETHYPFDLQGLSMKYLGIRDLLTLMSKKIRFNLAYGEGTDYSLVLDEKNILSLKNDFEELRKGEIIYSLEDLLQKLSKKVYRKGNQEYNMFDFIRAKPFCPNCKEELPDVLPRRCKNCNELTMKQKIIAKEFYEHFRSDFKQILQCEKCHEKVPVKHLNCPTCNPRDLPSSTFSEEERESAYIFLDQLIWGPSKIVFHSQFFETVLKGLEFEQDLYNELKKHIPEPQIKISTRILTGINDGWGVEVDLLVADKLQGKFRDIHEWVLVAIEAKNQESKVDKDVVQKFYDEVRPISDKLRLIMASANGFTDEARHLLHALKIDWYHRSLSGCFL